MLKRNAFVCWPRSPNAAVPVCSVPRCWRGAKAGQLLGGVVASRRAGGSQRGTEG